MNNKFKDLLELRIALKNIGRRYKCKPSLTDGFKNSDNKIHKLFNMGTGVKY